MPCAEVCLIDPPGGSSSEQSTGLSTVCAGDACIDQTGPTSIHFFIWPHLGKSLVLNSGKRPEKNKLISQFCASIGRLIL